MDIKDQKFRYIDLRKINNKDIFSLLIDYFLGFICIAPRCDANQTPKSRRRNASPV